MNDIITEHRNKIMDILDKFYEILKVYNKRWIQVFEKKKYQTNSLQARLKKKIGKEQY